MLGVAGDTIFALASGGGRAAIAVFRLSGGNCQDILRRVCGSVPAPRRAALRSLRDASGEWLDRALVLWLPGPASYTGEDGGELHVHGGPAVLQGVTAALLEAGARPAEAGEFTRRAFLNGRMDLLEAESIADLVAAETPAQRRQAMLQLTGALSERVEGWAKRLHDMLAWQEALIDFPDEQLPLDVEQRLLAEMSALRAELLAGVQDCRRGVRLREGLTFAVVGAPNVGKSSLVNVLAEREVAIVSPIPGTTRDALEVTLALDGIPVTFVDTAGLRETVDEIEAEGVRRAKARAEQADLVIEVVEPWTDRREAAGRLVVVNKIDLQAGAGGELAVSVRTGAGVEALRARLAGIAAELAAPAATPLLTRARHEASLRDAAACLGDAENAAFPELRAEGLRLALRSVSRITGAVDVESLLDSIFGQFCIGK